MWLLLYKVGVEPKDVSIITELQPRLSKHLLSVKPVIACLPREFHVKPNPDEVLPVRHRRARALALLFSFALHVRC